MTSPSSRTARIVTTVKPEKILIAMSGGVDSSVAALLLSEAGCECVGATMRLFHNEDAGVSREKSCCSLEDVEDARSVAYQLGMPFYVFNFTDGFGEQVMDRFVDAYERGATPNPCIDCNRYMKFAKLVERAELLGCDAVATGHYARIEQENGRWLLKKAVDDSKDQSYVLYFLNQHQLAHLRFPLGTLHKTEAREIAEKHGLVNARKRDSQDICFVPDGDYARVIELRTGQKASPAHSWTGRAMCWASTQASSTIRSASARDWASASSIRIMSVRSARRTTPSCSARTRPCSPRSWTRGTSTGSPMIRRPLCCTSRPKFATASRSSPRPARRTPAAPRQRTVALSAADALLRRQR